MWRYAHEIKKGIKKENNIKKTTKYYSIMYITYHKEIALPESVTEEIAHKLLCSEVLDYLKARDIHQTNYYFHRGNVLYFLYLDNGDRIDIDLRADAIINKF